jgi:iron(III) transport system ATP-binding protein
MRMSDRLAVMRAGEIVQVGRPEQIYDAPESEFVAKFFGDINILTGVVKGSRIPTPFGDVGGNGLAEGTQARVAIRNEGVRLEGAEASAGPTAQVVGSRLVGPYSIVHLAAPGGERLVAHVAGMLPPSEGTPVRITLDPRQTFVFPR